MIIARNLRKNYGRFTALDSVSLEVKAGEVVILIGPSGSGKSTFLRCLNLMERVDAGTVHFKGRTLYHETSSGSRLALGARELHQFRSRVVQVFQGFHLFPHMTALGNVMEGPLTVLGLERSAAREKACELLDLVGLADKRDAYPAQLSGGQQQRVDIARALAMDPDVLLLDEPTSALDPELALGVVGAIERLALKGMTMVVVTHEMRLARRIAHRVAFMDRGRILQCEPAEQLLGAGADRRIARFLGQDSQETELRYPPPAFGWGH